MSNAVHVLHAEDETQTVEGAGDVYRFLATGAQTGQGYFMVEATVPPGGGPPTHTQTREEEGFYVLEGQLTFWADGVRVEAQPGTFIHMPRDVPHRFLNEADVPARMLFWYTPAGLEGMFAEMSREPERYLAIAAGYGVAFGD